MTLAEGRERPLQYLSACRLLAAAVPFQQFAETVRASLGRLPPALGAGVLAPGDGALAVALDIPGQELAELVDPPHLLLEAPPAAQDVSSGQVPLGRGPG